MVEAKIYQRLARPRTSTPLGDDEVGYLLLEVDGAAVVELLLAVIVDAIGTPLIHYIALGKQSEVDYVLQALESVLCPFLIRRYLAVEFADDLILCVGGDVLF